MSPERLWMISIALRTRGFRRLALLVKKVNSMIYHNSLAPGASVSPDIRFGHHGFGTMVHSNVVIGRRVKIWHNVTIAVRSRSGWSTPHGITIEDDVKIGANAVIISPLEGSIRIGRGARIGAGAVVTHDVPPGARVVGTPARVLAAPPGDRGHSDTNGELDDAADPAADVESVERADLLPEDGTAH
jgi:serine O-acetyltransferase